MAEFDVSEGGLLITGLAELQAALREVEPLLYAELKEGLREGGRIIQEQARKDFIFRVTAMGRRGSAHAALGNARYTAEHFGTTVRGGAIVHVEQRLGKTTGLHPEWGALQMTEGLIPARSEKLDEVVERIEFGIGGLLHSHGL